MTADTRGHDSQMAWFLRAIEQPDGRWACRRGGHEYDVHESLEQDQAHSTVAAMIGRTPSCSRKSGRQDRTIA
ncbi:hypothetical protein ASG88_21955 [Nocardioides sp. Soil777]|nr:hypothetical protein ASG88_21955 [Nocardioides sp. Soil777]